MQLLDNSIMNLYQENKISGAEAYHKANDKNMFQNLLDNNTGNTLN